MKLSGSKDQILNMSYVFVFSPKEEFMPNDIRDKWKIIEFSSNSSELW